MGPQVQSIVQVDVRKEWRNRRSLRRAHRARRPSTVLHDSCAQPFLDESHDSPISDPVLDKLHYPSVIHGSKEISDVCVEHPVYVPRPDRGRECIQHRAGRARVEIRTRNREILFVDGVHHLDHRALDELVLQRRDAERTLPSVGLGDVYPPRRLRSIRSPMQSCVKLPEVILEPHTVLHPGDSIDSCRCVPLKLPVRFAQNVHGHVMQERRKFSILVLSGSLTLTVERTARGHIPVQCPACVLFDPVSLGRTPSLHVLLGDLHLVRPLRWYHGPVRLPRAVHRRRSASGLPDAARVACPGSTRTSPFSHKKVPHVLGGFDRAEPIRTSHSGAHRVAFRFSGRRRHSDQLISRLDTRPVRAPVNASPQTLRITTHDSGSSWFATPST